jgi:hypothetical protein
MARTLITRRREEVVDDLVLLDRHRVKEDFLREKTGRKSEKTGRENAPRRLDSLMITKTASRQRGLAKTPSPRPDELKFIFCSGADLERADSALLHEAAELSDWHPLILTVWKSTN